MKEPVENSGRTGGIQNLFSWNAFLTFVRKTWFLWIVFEVYYLASHWHSYSDKLELIFRDLTQLYLAAKANSAGISPYLAISELRATRFGISSNYQEFPTPYPPTIVLLISLLAQGSFRAFHWTFDVLYILSVLGCAALLLRLSAQEERSIFTTIGLAALLLCSNPCRFGLLFGQFDPFILFFLLAGCFMFSRGREFASGAFLCLATSIKFLGWPVLLAQIIRSRRSLQGAFICAAFLLGGVLLSFNVVDITQRYLPSMSRTARIVIPSIGNQSAFALFDKLTRPPEVQLTAQGAISITEVELPDTTGLRVAFAVATVLTLLAAIWSTTIADSYAASAWLLAAALVLSPLVWGFYYLLCLPFLFHVWKTEKSRIWKLVLLLFCCSAYVFDAPSAANLFAAWTATGPGTFPMSATHAILAVLPFFFLLALVARTGIELKRS